MQKIRVMIAGARSTSLPVLARIVERTGDVFDVIGQAAGTEKTLGVLRENDADVLLADASVPEAFVLCSRITEVYPDLCVVLVGGRRSYEWLKRAMDAGAQGYIAEDECTAEYIRMEVSRALRISRRQALPPVYPLEFCEIAGKSRAVVKTVEFVRQNYRRNISVTEAAEYAGISESHLRRCFRRETGLSFVDFLTKYRIDAAKILMDQGEKPIHIVSGETGFSSPRYFDRVFKKYTGMTPREYMNSSRRRVNEE